MKTNTMLLVSFIAVMNTVHVTAIGERTQHSQSNIPDRLPSLERGVPTHPMSSTGTNHHPMGIRPPVPYTFDYSYGGSRSGNCNTNHNDENTEDSNDNPPRTGPPRVGEVENADLSGCNLPSKRRKKKQSRVRQESSNLKEQQNEDLNRTFEDLNRIFDQLSPEQVDFYMRMRLNTQQGVTRVKEMCELNESEFTQFVNKTTRHIEQCWPEHEALLIDWKPYVSGVLLSFRQNAETNPDRCVVSLCVGDVQASKTQVAALTAIVIHYVHQSKEVSNKPFMVLIQDTNSNKQSMFPKFERLESSYNNGNRFNCRPCIKSLSDLELARNNGGTVIIARTACQIKGVNKGEHNNSNDSEEEYDYDSNANEAYIVMDEADNIIGSCEGRQEYEKEIDNLLRHKNSRGTTFLSATNQLPFGYVLNQVTQPYVAGNLRIEPGWFGAFLPVTHRRRANYIGFKAARPFTDEFGNDLYLERASNHANPSVVLDSKDNNTCYRYFKMCEEVMCTPYSCMMSRMCTGVTCGITQTKHAVRVGEWLETSDDTKEKTAFQVIVHCSHTPYQGNIGFRAIGKDKTEAMSKTTRGFSLDYADEHGFMSISELITILTDIEKNAVKMNPRYIRTIKKKKNGEPFKLSVAQLPLLLYHIRKQYKRDVPIYIYGNTTLGRSLSLVSVDPFTDNSDRIQVMSCVTHMAQNIPENKIGCIGKNHCDTVQTFLRFATTLKNKFHDHHGFQTIKILTQKNVWDVVKSSIEFNMWMYNTCPNNELSNTFRVIQKFTDDQSVEHVETSESDSNSETELNKNIVHRAEEYAARKLQIPNHLSTFFQGTNWGHRHAQGVTRTFAHVIYYTGLNKVKDEHGEHSEQVHQYSEKHDSMLDKGVIEKRRPDSDPMNYGSSSSSKRHKGEFKWYTEKLKTHIAKSAAKHSIHKLITEMQLKCNGANSAEYIKQLNELPLPSFELNELLNDFRRDCASELHEPIKQFQDLLNTSYDKDPDGIWGAIYWTNWEDDEDKLTRDIIDTKMIEKYGRYRTGGSTMKTGVDNGYVKRTDKKYRIIRVR